LIRIGMMRKYKNLIIPDRKPRDNFDIENKRGNYCKKRKCGGINCETCLFDHLHIDQFEEWYLAKNK